MKLLRFNIHTIRQQGYFQHKYMNKNLAFKVMGTRFCDRLCARFR